MIKPINLTGKNALDILWINEIRYLGINLYRPTSDLVDLAVI